MKKALIVVDYQKDFVDGALGFEKAVQLEQAICQKIEQAREQGEEILFTFDTHGEDYLQTQEGRNLPIEHCKKGSYGWQLYGKVEQLRCPEDRCFDKPCFGSWELGEYAREQQFDVIELCGVVSNICVLSNAVLLKAALPEAKLIVDARCTASNDDGMNEKALDILHQNGEPGAYVLGEIVAGEKGVELW